MYTKLFFRLGWASFILGFMLSGCANFVGPECTGVCFDPAAARYNNAIAIQNMNQTLIGVRNSPPPYTISPK